MIDRVSSLMYSKSWETGGTPWQNNNFGYIRYEGISDGEVCIYATKNEPTITFVYVVSKRDREAYYSYRYSLKTKELTYSTNDYEMKEVDSFLFNEILIDWYNSNLPNDEQTDQTNFSPNNWGDYVFVTPYQLSQEYEIWHANHSLIIIVIVNAVVPTLEDCCLDVFGERFSV